MTGWMWLLVTVIGVFMLGAVIAFGIRQTDKARRNRAAVRRSEQATKRLYEEEEKSSE